MANVFMEFLGEAGMTLADFFNQSRQTVMGLDRRVNEQKDEISRQKVELQAKDETITARNREIEALHKTVAEKNEKAAQLEGNINGLNVALAETEATVKELTAKVTELTEKLALVKMQAKTMPKNLERLEGGGIRLPITLDVDDAEHYLSEADTAGEDPATYIQQQVENAVRAYAQFAGTGV
jgi:uncharacterized coiled-coil protein SlyX